MRHFFMSLLAGLGLFALPAVSRADDGMFPPAASAKPFIDFDGRGFLVNGKRTFIASGSLHYPRLPRALWRETLLKMKRLGFNTVQTYAFWNFHEPKENEWDFSGDKDLDAFLKLVKQLGMYATVRVGPYVCAEWDSGGYPVWLRFKPDVRVREDNTAFEAEVDKWLGKVMPIVAANQINRGGSVIMVQLENEHPKGWGREMPNPYFTHLRDTALALGLEVPYFFSGLHHGSDPAGGNSWDSKGRDNPWYSTEFWPGWYDLYGPLSPDRLRNFTRGQEKIVAYGGNGYNFYMLYGGTNFATWNNQEDASCYDYGSAIGQAGDLRPIAYNFKRVNDFSRSFAEITENSENADAAYQNYFPGAKLKITARKSPAGEIVFMDNDSDARVNVGGFFVEPGEIAAQVSSYRIAPGLLLNEAKAHIINLIEQGATKTLIIRGAAGDGKNIQTVEGASLEFRLEKGGTLEFSGENTNDWKLNAPTKTITLQTVFPAGSAPKMNSLKINGKIIRVFAVNNDMADRTWTVEAGGKTYIVIGPDYVGEAVIGKNEKVRLTTERRADNHFPTLVYGEDDTPIEIIETPKIAPLPAAPKLSAWQVRRADAEAQPDFDAAQWLATEQPAQMGADGDNGAYAWYRTKITVPKAGDYLLQFSAIGDWISVFANGKRAYNAFRRDEHTQKIALNAGENTLAVFAAHYGRDKLFNYLGPLISQDIKGIGGTVTMPEAAVATVAVTKWEWQPDTRADHTLPERLNAQTAPEGPTWQPTQIGQDVFDRKKGFAWYRTKLEAIPGPHRLVRFANVDDNATVYFNSKKMLHHDGYGQPFEVSLDSRWNENGPNEIRVLVENTDGPGSIDGPVNLISLTGAENPPLSNWKMRGGWPYAENDKGHWNELKDNPNVPALYRASFTYTAPAANGPQPVLRAALRGMSRGFVWLNGHNLGRYPERTPAPGIWLPPCWLRPGANELVLFDEEGQVPYGVSLMNEAGATRWMQAN